LIVKYGETVAPAATVTEAGTVTPVALLDRFTTTPPAVATPLRVTLFNVVEVPPTTDVGESVTESRATGFTVKLAVLVTPLEEAEIVTVMVLVTAEVVIVKYGEELAPAATVTDAGTVTRVSPLDRFTTTLPGAGPFSVTLFNVVGVPPATEVGDSVTESKATGFTVKIAVLVMAL
jgi:hypothetical protein